MLVCLSGAYSFQDALRLSFFTPVFVYLPHLETKMLAKPRAPCQMPYNVICFPNAQVKLQMCSAIVVVLSYIL